jgi:transposase
MHIAAVDPPVQKICVERSKPSRRICMSSRVGFNPVGDSVAVESIGIYWIPACEILEQRRFKVILMNAYYAKASGGAKRT